MSKFAPQKDKHLLVCLGNPGKKYTTTRHNAGFLLADFFHSLNRDSLSPWKKEKKYECKISKGIILNHDVILCKPLTFMNNSGIAVQKLTHDLQQTTYNLMVISDDIDLPFGSLRIRSRGSAGGHNGLKSVIEHLGTDSFIRLRIGIAHNKQPTTDNRQQKIPAGKFVLQRFSRDELKTLKETILPKASDVLTTIITEGAEKAQQKFNTKKYSTTTRASRPFLPAQGLPGKPSCP